MTRGARSRPSPGARTRATQKRIDANRRDARESTGPTSPGGKDTTKFNGLRAEQIVLPGENRAEIEAELKGRSDEWNPPSDTRAILVERAAASTSRRCTSGVTEGATPGR